MKNSIKLGLAVSALLALVSANKAEAQSYVGFSKSTIQFGGDGQDGALTNPSGTTISRFPLARSISVTTSEPSMDPHCIVQCLGAITFSSSGQWIVSNSWQGGNSKVGSSIAGEPGEGPAPGYGGQSGTTATGGGGGGGAGGAGGGGGQWAAATTVNRGGNIPGNPAFHYGVGSSGGSGGTTTSGTSGAGGASGGSITIVARGKVTLIGQATGCISVKGGTGGNASAAGGGGGGGGAGRVAIYSQVEIDKGSAGNYYFDLRGGDGGTGNGSSQDGGGGGGGGLGIIVAPVHSGTNTALSTAATGGAGGASGTAGNNGNGGQVVSITQRPTGFLYSMHQQSNNLLALRQIKTLTAKDPTFIEVGEKEHTSLLAAMMAKPGQFDGLCKAILHGGTYEDAVKTCAVDLSKDSFNVSAFQDEPGVQEVQVGDLPSELLPAS